MYYFSNIYFLLLGSSPPPIDREILYYTVIYFIQLLNLNVYIHCMYINKQYSPLPSTRNQNHL